MIENSPFPYGQGHLDQVYSLILIDLHAFQCSHPNTYEQHCNIGLRSPKAAATYFISWGCNSGRLGWLEGKI